MELDKKIGYWVNYATLRDDYAYWVYCQEHREHIMKGYKIHGQGTFMHRYATLIQETGISLERDYLKTCYNKANLILRQEKINKITDGI